MTTATRCSVIVLFLAATGCASTVPTGSVLSEGAVHAEAMARDAREVLALLAYYQLALSLSSDELRREYAITNQSYLDQRSEDSRLKLIMLLSLPGTAFRDEQRLTTLLEGAGSRSASMDSPRRHLITLLGRLHDERRQQLAQAREAHRRADALLRAERKIAEDLQKKLDALLRIDRSLRDRAMKKEAP